MITKGLAFVILVYFLIKRFTYIYILLVKHAYIYELCAIRQNHFNY